jgi:hypothetical protein
LLKKINADQIRKNGASIEIVVWSIGFLDVGSYKGYLYMPGGSGKSYKSVDSLDNFTPEGRYESLMREIGEGWCLYYEHFPG